MKNIKMQEIELSIIILSWNTSELLEKCLKSVIANILDFASKVEIIVVDNASSDNSVLMVKKNFPQVILLANKNNLGFAKANNLAIKKAKGKYVLLLNSDTLVENQAILRLKQYLENNQEVAVVSPLILNPDKTVQEDPVYLRLPSYKIAFFYHNPILKKLFTKVPFLKRVIFCPVKINQEHQLEQFSGAGAMFRNEIFQKIGLLDEDFPFYFEDSDFSFRLKKNKLKIVVYPEAKIIHFGGASMKKQTENKNKFFYYQRNYSSFLLFCHKHYSKQKKEIIKLILILNWLAMSFLYLLTSFFLPSIKNKAALNLSLIGYFLKSKSKDWQQW